MTKAYEVSDFIGGGVDAEMAERMAWWSNASPNYAQAIQDGRGHESAIQEVREEIARLNAEFGNGEVKQVASDGRLTMREVLFGGEIHPIADDPDCNCADCWGD